MKKTLGIIGAAVTTAALLATSSAQASLANNTYTVIVSEGVTNGNGIDSSTNPIFTGTNTASASFTYTGPLNFNNTAGPVTTPSGDTNLAFGFTAASITGYSGSGTVSYGGSTVADYGSVTSFLNSSASSAPKTYASYYQFDLGIVQAGTVLTITHDDGAALYQGNTRVGTSVTGVTGRTTDTITVGTTADTVLRYTRQNSTPSILQVSAVFPATPVPEPVSLGLLGAGLAGLGLIRRRQRAA